MVIHLSLIIIRIRSCLVPEKGKLIYAKRLSRALLGVFILLIAFMTLSDVIMLDVAPK